MWRFRTALAMTAIGLAGAAADLSGQPGPAEVLPVLEPGVLHLAAGRLDLRACENLLTALPDSFDPDRAYLLAFDGPLTAARRARLEALGVEVGDFLPTAARFVRLGGVDPRDLAALEFAGWLTPVDPAWKRSPEIGSRVLVTAERQALDRRGQYMLDITMLEHVTAGEAVDVLAAVPGLVFRCIENVGGNETATVTLPKERVADLAALPSVQFIEETGEVTLRNQTARWVVQSNQNGQNTLWQRGLHGEGQIIGIMDGRMNPNHCSFVDTEPIGPTHRKIEAYNTSPGTSTHGTHVSGTAVGDAGDDSDTRGMAYLARMVFDDTSYTENGIIAHLTQHHNQGARLHSNSWGDDGTTQYNGLTRGIDAFSYDNEESLVLFAVTNLGTLKNPENAKNLLAVGGTDDAPNQHLHCTGGRGPTSDGRRKPEIYAPGCGIRSSAGSGCSTTSLSGTSMACPAVAGAGLLVRQYYAEGFYPGGAPRSQDAFTPSGALTKATLLNSAVDLTGVSGYPSDTEGWGRVLADDALFFAGESRRLSAADVRNDAGLATGEFTAHQVIVASPNEPLKITLVFTDPPATAGANFAAINDLNLEVTAPGGAIYKGNVFVSGESQTGGVFDDRNNVEQVHRPAPEAGAWTVRIVGAAVNEGLQGYALVATGDIVPDSGDATFEPHSVTVETGTPIAGDLSSIEASDDDFFVVESDFGFQFQEPFITQTRFVFRADVFPQDDLRLTIESHADAPGGTARVELRDFVGDVYDLVHQYPLVQSDQIEIVAGLASSRYVNPANNRVRIRITHASLAVFSAFGFDSSFDQIRVEEE